MPLLREGRPWLACSSKGQGAEVARLVGWDVRRSAAGGRSDGTGKEERIEEERKTRTGREGLKR